jgi:quinol-cytochrome oxidoreductase complex cytochrome b subunit
VSSATLIIFYTIHTTVMPVLITGLMMWHFWRVRRARGVVVPRNAGQPSIPAPERAPALPHLFVRELAVGLCLAAFVVTLAVFAGAPLGDAANPGMSPNPAKAPWYFVGFQELLLHFHPLFAVFVIPLMAAVALIMLPYVRHDSGHAADTDDFAGVFMLSHRGRRMAGVAAALALILIPLWVIIDDRLFAGTSLIASGLLPWGIFVAAITAAYIAMRRVMRTTRGEAIQTCFVFVLTAFVVLTVVGVWFRGPGMALGWFASL